MNGNRTRVEPDLEPGGADPSAEVEILAVEEEPLVETIDELERRPADEEACTGGPLGRPRLRVRGRIANELTGPRRAGKDPVEEERFGERGPEARKAPQRVVQ